LIRISFILFLLIARNSWANQVKSLCPSVELPNDADYDIYALDKKLGENIQYQKCALQSENSAYLISTADTRPIGNITIESDLNEITGSLEALLYPLIGKSNTLNTREILYNQLAERLENRGFPKASWRVDLQSGELSDILVVEIQLGEECQIKKTTLPKDFERLVPKNLLEDELCDSRIIQQKLESLEDSIRSKGYNEARLRIEKLDYFDNKRFANIIITGSVGEKISYVVLDQGSGTKIADIFFGERNRIQPRFISPDAVAGELKSTYQSKGYIDVMVSGPERSQRNGSIEYIWRVNSGRKNTIRNINFDGLSFFSEKQALDLFPSSIIGKVSDFGIEDFNKGLETLTASYIKNGFLDVSFREPRFTRVGATDATDVTVFVEEGLQYRTSEIKIEKNQNISQEEIMDSISVEKGNPFDRTILGDLQTRIKNLYNSRGYAHINVRVSTRDVKLKKFINTTIVIEIDEGPLVKFGKIVIIGLTKTKREIVEREIDFKSGSIWNPSLIEKSRGKIASIGIFKSVNIVATDPNAFTRQSEYLDLSIIVKESKPGVVSFGPGYDISKGFRYVAEGSYNNLFGTARRISIRGGFSEEKQQAAIGDSSLVGRKLGLGYLEPWLLGLPLSGKISASHSATASNFWQFNNQLEGEVSWQLSRLLDTQYSVFIRNEMNKDVGSSDQSRLYLASGNTRKGVAGLRMAFDGRDSIAFPTKGIYIGLENSVADYRIGGEYKFHHFDLNTSVYKSFKSNLVYAIGIVSSSFWNVSRKNAGFGYDILPASDRLLAGGADLIRGFEKQLGPFLEFTSMNEQNNSPIVDHEIIGGTNRFVFKQELRLRTSEDSSFAFQIDSGNTWSSGEERTKFRERFEDKSSSSGKSTNLYGNYPLVLAKIAENPINYSRSVYWSTGFSYNLFTPVGALRVGIAIPFYEPNRCSISKGNCLVRSKSSKTWYGKSQLDLSVGTKF